MEVLMWLVGLVITQGATAAGVYAAIKSDVREAIIKATMAQQSADRAHARIDDL